MDPYNYVPVPHPQLLPDVLPPGVADTLVNRLYLEAGAVPPTIHATEAMLAAAGFAPGTRAALEARMDWLIREHGGGRVEWAGVKPETLRNADGVFLFPLPDCALSIRVFPGDFHPRNRILYFDLYNTDMRTPINTPPSFRFSSVRPAGRLMSVEESDGIRHEDICPGEERFAVEEGTPCRLQRTGKPDFLFRIPSRPQPQVIDVGYTQPIPFG
ncbi:hypothetical protein B0H13DRAFT_1865354 [Mycena leptocephala]|nr:hypothetical protein B0H13DRAFT_1865354 [Mycena leptocephala]